MAWTRYEVKQPVSPRLPKDERSLLEALKKELWPLFNQLRGVLNWSVRWLGLVQVDDNQTPVALADAVVAGTGVTITQVGTTPAQQLEFKANATEITNIVNTTTIVNAPAAGATLHTALCSDLFLRAPCVGLMYLSGPWAGNWTAIPGISTWQFTYASPLQIDGAGAVSPSTVARDGDRLFVSGETVHDGIYEVVDCGIHNTDGSTWDGSGGYNSTKPVIRRATDANTPTGLCHDMAVQIVKRTAAATSDGYYFTLTTADPVVVDTTSLTFTSSSTRTSTAGTYALTPSQLASQHAVSSTIQEGETVGGFTYIKQMLPDGTFCTIAGTPGVSVIPAGLFTFYVRCSASAIGPAPARIRANVFTVASPGDAGTLVLYSISPPIASTSFADMSWQAELAAPVSIAPTDLLEIRFFAETTPLAANVDILVVWSDATHYTRVVTTIPMGGQSTGVHNDLTGRSEPDCHPTSAITDLTDRLLAANPDGLLVASMDESGNQLDGLHTYAGGSVGTMGGLVKSADGVKSMGSDIATTYDMTNVWAGGPWRVQFKASVSSIASATYVRITLYEYATGPTLTAIGWTYDFLLTATAETAYQHDIEVPEWDAGTGKKLLARIEAYTASVADVTVTISGGGEFRVKSPTVAPFTMPHDNLLLKYGGGGGEYYHLTAAQNAATVRLTSAPASYTPATGSQTVALDCTSTLKHNVSGHASGTACTFTITGVTAGDIFYVELLNGATASTIAAWFSGISWDGGSAPTHTATANKAELYVFKAITSSTFRGGVAFAAA